ncbi:inorganic phosphate transporter [Candidatus Gracilibacteria bacterium]|nr:inorganic phosphate transporter [Candidatus Gracilibacteria bacterium]NUJ99431.1 inorganic phosphate transporter [Candidatus Gracilibacteria bacterium]
MLFGLDITTLLLIFICLGLVALFEFVNGSHDTANAISPVIYSHSLKPRRAVLLATVMNFLGVLLGGIGVAIGIIHLLPLEIISEQENLFGVFVVLSLLITAILWNAGTWYLGLPASSSHTLIGSIFGVCLAISFLPIHASEKVDLNWHKIIEVIESLLISPLIGFGLAFLIMFISYKIIKSKRFFSKPEKKEVPNTGLRSLLIASSSWVSFAHGSNDGQKGVGLAMLILISLAPNTFGINPDVNMLDIKKDISYISQSIENDINQTKNDEYKQKLILAQENIKNLLGSLENQKQEGKNVRTNILKIQENIKNIKKEKSLIAQANAGEIGTSIDSKDFIIHSDNLSKVIDYAPKWIILLISLSLGLGTMFGRKRIVKTIGKKIGNHKLKYAESASSAIITAMTITFASRLGLPVSTTHIFSSSIAGCMMTGKKPGVQQDTVKHILLAWILTLPITIVLGGGLFSLFWVLFLR